MSDDRSSLNRYYLGCSECKNDASLSCPDCYSRVCASRECQDKHCHLHDEEYKDERRKREHQTLKVKKTGLSPGGSGLIQNVLDSVSRNASSQSPEDSAIASSTSTGPTESTLASSSSPSPSPGTQETITANPRVYLPLSHLQHALTPSRPEGIYNMSATCYMASALQVLMATDVLRQFFLQNKYQSEINHENKFGSKGKVANAFHNLCDLMKKSKKCISINNFFLLYRTVNDTYYSPNAQHDSQEFLSDLLDRLHEDLNTAPMVKGSKQPVELKKKDTNESCEQAAQRFRRLLNSRDNSIIHDLFGGMFKANIKCDNCNYSTCSFERYCLLTLTLPTPLKKIFKVVVFPLPRGTMPEVLFIGLPYGARLSDLAEKVSKLISNCSRDKIILVNPEHLTGSLKVMDTREHPEDIFQRHYANAGDIKNIPSLVYAFEDNSSEYYFHDPQLTDRIKGANFQEGDASGVVSPRWCPQEATQGDLQFGATPVVVNLRPRSSDENKFLFPIVFRVPIYATLGQVRHTVIHALKVMARDWSWSEKEEFSLIDRERPKLKIRRLLSKKHVEWFYANATDEHDFSITAEKFNFIWTDQFARVESDQFAEREVSVEYESMCTDFGRRSQVLKQILDPSDSQHHHKLRSDQWEIEKRLLNFMAITGPGDDTSYDNGSSIQKLYLSKNLDHCWVFAVADLQDLQDLQDSKYSRRKIMSDSYASRYASYSKDWLTTPDMSSPSSEEGHQDPELALHDPLLYTKILTGKKNPWPRLERNQSRNRGMEIIDEKANSEFIEKEFEEALPAIKIMYQHFEKHLGVPVPHFDFTVAELIDFEDLTIAAFKSKTFPAITQLVDSEACESFQRHLNSSDDTANKFDAVPIMKVEGLLCQNPRCFKMPYLKEEKQVNINDLLLQDKTPEHLFGEEAWKCDKCKKKTSSCKDHAIWSTGPYVLINLKRFSFFSGSGNSRKNPLEFVYPDDGLIDLSKLINDPSQHEKRFEIYGAIVHQGSLEAGHYVSVIRGNLKLKQWFLVDDEIRKEISEESAREYMKNSYIIALRTLNCRPQPELLPADISLDAPPSPTALSASEADSSNTI
eukprot:GHVH01007155.1.p1 GENE.GHVH01007155.1~~GHVH01007155.1.p1  ORF type:complete len:1097 (+),score=157.32 GHVH01007155.1:43-3291(+)